MFFSKRCKDSGNSQIDEDDLFLYEKQLNVIVSETMRGK